VFPFVEEEADGTMLIHGKEFLFLAAIETTLKVNVRGNFTLVMIISVNRKIWPCNEIVEDCVHITLKVMITVITVMTK
jgi:hypothetical protein